MRPVRARGRIRAAAGLLGPAFVASVAYVDPGNFAANFAGGAEHGYELVRVIVMANLMAILVQYLTTKAGLCTGRSLPELCRERFGRRANVMLWLQAEMVAMATDLAEFTGAAVGINLIFGLPLFPAGLITAVVAFVILGLEQRGYRRFELAIIALLALLGLGFAYLFAAVGGQHYYQLAAGLLPRLAGADTLDLTVAIIGATVMPHVIYLHSALQANRVHAARQGERRALLAGSKRDCITGLGLAGLVNLAMLCIAAALFLPAEADRARQVPRIRVGHGTLVVTKGGCSWPMSCGARTPHVGGPSNGASRGARPCTAARPAARPPAVSGSAWPRPSGSAPGGLAPIPPFLTNTPAPPGQPCSGLAIMLLTRQHPSRVRPPAPRPRSSRNS
jgi:Mn2+/Fe2+ NRAMP family transporter